MSKKFSRRRFLQGAGILGAGVALASKTGPFYRSAFASTSDRTPRFLITIQLRGGLDPEMHFDFQDRGLHDRDLTAGETNTTAGGIRWNTASLSAMAPHMADMCIIRNIKTNTTDHLEGAGELWWGTPDIEEARLTTPWTNYLASQILTQRSVLLPNLVATWGLNGTEEIADYIRTNNSSPDPLGAAQQLNAIADLLQTLDVTTGFPPTDYQQIVSNYSESQDMNVYSEARQPKTIQLFSQASSQATALAGTNIDALWPPSQAVMDAYGLFPSNVFQTDSNGPIFPAALAFSAALFEKNLCSCITVSNKGLQFDSHGAPSGQVQRIEGKFHFDAIGAFLTQLKATASPFDANCSLLDHTVVHVTSEMSRGNTPDPEGGTTHWDWTQSYFFGGPFKRDYAFGATGADLKGIPADFVSGELNSGFVPQLTNVFGTIISAFGFDPVDGLGSLYSPISAVLI